MNFFRFLNLIIKNFIILFGFIIFMVIINSLGVCQMEKIDVSSENAHRAELSENKSVNVVPYTKGSSESLTVSSETKGKKLEQTVKGLKDAGYSLDQITVVLKNDNNDASAVSIACLKQGFSGDKIFQSLIKAGFSKNNAESALPLSIRQEIQIFGITTNYNEALNIGSLNTNNKQSSAEVNNDKVIIATTAEVLEVPVSVGVTFNGLSSWNEFQDNRFKAEK